MNHRSGYLLLPIFNMFASSRQLARCHALKSLVIFCRAIVKKILIISPLASVFSPILLRDPEPLGVPPILTPLQKRRFLGHFLV
jgi:hypothetical protein